MRAIATDGVAWSAYLSVCLLITFVNPAETAEPIEMPFGILTRVYPKNHVLEEVQIPPNKGQVLGVVQPIEKHGNHYSGVSGSKKSNCNSGTAIASGKAPAWPMSH